MITNIKTIRDFVDSTDEGKILIAALSVLTSIECKDIREGKWGGMTHPDDALSTLVDLANRIYYEQEWKEEQKRIKRDNKIDDIIG